MREERTKAVDGPEAQTRFRAMYLNNTLNAKRGLFEGCTEREIAILLKRKSLEEWVLDGRRQKKNLLEYLKFAYKPTTDKLIKKILKR